MKKKRRSGDRFVNSGMAITYSIGSSTGCQKNHISASQSHASFFEHSDGRHIANKRIVPFAQHVVDVGPSHELP